MPVVRYYKAKDLMSQSFTLAPISRQFPVLRLRIRLFFGLLDPDPLVRDPDPSIIKKIVRKVLDSYCFMTFYL
jgi:hypothetical protein